ncbi:MAG: hypothetical protein Q9Q40_12290 [Acidobacteriota bacterium]|nr:hypothetical protein [Acidobacteriota bacterium]
MSKPPVRRASFCVPLLLALLLGLSYAAAATVRPEASVFDDLAQPDPGAVLSTRTHPIGTLGEADPLRRAWEAFRAHEGAGWSLRFDPRSGLPALAQGRTPWIPGPGNDLTGAPAAGLGDLEALARRLIERYPDLLGPLGDQLVLDPAASRFDPQGASRVTFRQRVGDLQVDGAHYDFQVVRGNLVSFGASRLAPVRISLTPTLSADEARAVLEAYVGPDRMGLAHMVGGARLGLMPVSPDLAGAQEWTGNRGTGITHRLYWSFVLQAPGEPARWVAKIDAHSGEMLAFFDSTHYEAVRGAIYPISPDGDCANDGCEVAGYPMPFVDVAEDGGADVYTGDFGVYTCATLGSEVRTNLSGQYYYITDTCGAIDEPGVCDDDVDLGLSAGPNCTVAPGASAGNTEASRTMYHSVNRVGQKARFYLPDNSWLNGRVNCRSNVSGTCNAFWNGTINMYREGGGCNNTSLINGVVTHEWGHGFDQNDGGGYDNPSEAYADVVAIFESRESCVGRGFYADGRTCSGYGDNCLTCTGIRDMDWAAREANTPATPTNFTGDRCGGGGGPCGKEVHCESYVISEAIYDLATRDLPAAGWDEASAWQIAEYLWYSSRDGSTGDVYNCSLPDADSCGTGTWYHRMRVADDDDGDLSNGTPNAAAIFAAFDRHDIACGLASDPENQSQSACPTLAPPVVTANPTTNAVELTWDPVPDAGSYVIHRTDIGCNRGHTPLARIEAPATTYTDDEVINDFTVYYRVQAFGTNPQCAGPVSACIETAPQPFAGKVRFDQATYGCSNLITLRVTDANVGAATVSVTVWSDTEPTPETVILNETAAGSGKYEGTITTTSSGPVNGDGLLSTTDGDLLTAEYIDADDGAGGTNVTRQDTAASDCIFPVISNVGESGITGSQATVSWNTDEISDTVLIWGEVKPPSQTATGANGVTQHDVTLTGLAECTVYYYEVQSTDPAGNLAADDNSGAYYHFETLGDFGDGLQPCHAGQARIDNAVYSCSDSVTFRVTDLDLNADPEVVETAVLKVTSSTDTTGELVTVTETGVNTSKFTGSISTVSGAATPGDGLLQLSDGDVITVTYEDADDGSGSPAINFDVADADCGGPPVKDLQVDTITDQRATIRWNTDEPGDTVVEWGTTPSLGQTSSSSSLTGGHSVTLNQFSDCQEVYFRVSSTDAYGNTTTIDDSGQPLRFALGNIPGLYYRETFENGTNGWTLQGEWEVDSPQGLGGDPADAYNNQGVLGDDLSGLGSDAGRYEPGAATVASSPVLDATNWTHTELLYRRRLRVHGSDDASLWVFAGPGYPLYRNDGATLRESTYSLQRNDLTSLVDGRPQVHLEFRQSADGSVQEGGWTIDDVILKDGSLPDFGSCSDCSSIPSFRGATSAKDNDACGASGVTVSWDKAVSWGTGGGGSYNVYRSTDPAFVPSASTLVASGVTTLSYDDTAAPTDSTLYYVVRAETDETCGSGPANSGNEDANDVHVTVSETTSWPTPPAVQQVRVDLVGKAHVRLSWDAAPDATVYNVYRSSTPDGNFTLLGTTTTLHYEDRNQGDVADTWFYLVKGSNPCDNEGP